MGEERAMGMDDLPHHLLQKIVQEGDLGAADLARLEMSCYTFKAADGIEPYRYKSMTENVAVQYCQSDPLFVRLPPTLQSRLVDRCRGNRKLVMRFLQATEQAAAGIRTATGRVQVLAGKYLTFIIKGEGRLFGCGSNQYGVLGSGPLGTIPVEVQVPFGRRVKQVSGTHNHVAFVTESGEVYTHGDNSSGCCGHGHNAGPIYRPTLVEALLDIPCKQVSTGLSFTAAVTGNGKVYTWGSGSHGQLGHGDTAEQSHPVKVEALTIGVVTQIATGASYTLALIENGDLYSFGYASKCCLGRPSNFSDPEPGQVDVDENCFFTSVAAGDEHAAAIDSLGQVYTWGNGYCGALGHGNESDVRKPQLLKGLTSVLAVQVTAGRRRTLVLADSGQMFGFGWTGFGSLGLTCQDSRGKALTPIELVDHYAAQATEGKAEQRIGQVSAGFYHTVCLSRDGLFLSFGDGEKGQQNFDANFPKIPVA